MSEISELKSQLEALKETVAKMKELAKEAKKQIVEIESALKEELIERSREEPPAVEMSPFDSASRLPFDFAQGTRSRDAQGPPSVMSSPPSNIMDTVPEKSEVKKEAGSLCQEKSKALQYWKGSYITPKMMAFLHTLMLHDFNDNAEVVAKTLGVTRKQLIRMVESARNMHLLTIYGNEHIVILEDGVKVLMERAPNHVNARFITLQESQVYDILDFHNLKMERAKDLGVDVYNLNTLLKYMTLRLDNLVNREVVDVIVGTIPVSSISDEDYKRWCLLKWDSYSDVPAHTNVQTALVQHGSGRFVPVNDWTLSQMRVFCEKAKVKPKGPKNRKVSWAKPIEEFLAANRAEVVPVKIEWSLPKILELLSKKSMRSANLRLLTRGFLPCMTDLYDALDLAHTQGFIEYDNSMRICITHRGLAYLQ